MIREHSIPAGNLQNTVRNIMFCKALRAGCPYDNAPMERFFNTLKNEYVYHHRFQSAEAMDEGIYEFARVHYNYVGPHTYNGAKTPMKASVQQRKGDS